MAWLVASVDIAAQAKLHTIYYDKRGIGTEHRKFADHMRLVPCKEGTKRPFRDFYITGELMREGVVVSVDRV